MDILLIIALAGFSIKCFKDITEVAFSEWQTVQWMTLGVGILLLALCVLRLVMFIKTTKGKQENSEENQEERLARFEEEKRMREERRKAIYTYDEEDHPEGEVSTPETAEKTPEEMEREAFFDMLLDKASEEISEDSEQK